MKRDKILLHEYERELLPCELYPFIHENGIRPAVIVLPGGAYHSVCDREKLPVADRFYSIGFNVFFLNYATADRFPEICFPQHILQLLAAIRFIRQNAESFLCTGEVIPCGFSAGGHLSGCSAVLYHDRKLLHALKAREADVRPTAAILCYPVVTGQKRYLQYESFRYLTGSEDIEKYKKYSLERRVSEKTAPMFLWHTAQDRLVPPQNSILLAKKLADFQVPFELHVFEEGIHGLALADETSCEGYPELVLPDVAKWVDLCKAFVNRHIKTRL